MMTGPGRHSLCLTLLLSLVVTSLVASVALGGEGKFGGIGLQVVPLVTGELVVLGVSPGSPAEKGGVTPGDLIVTVDGFALRGSDFTEVVGRYLWGEVGSPVTIEYLRPGRSGLESATLRRVLLDRAIKPPPGVRLLSPEGQ